MIDLNSTLSAIPTEKLGETAISILSYILGGLLLLAVIALISLILWICTIVYQAKRKQYTWMVFILLFHITMLIYWITWCFKHKKWNRRRK